MQDGFSDLLHLGILAFPQDTSSEHLNVHEGKAQRTLSEEDRTILEQLTPIEVQDWCLSRIKEHQNQNRSLRELHGSGARGVISKTKSYIRALRSVYNDAAPINQRLPPEVLIEVFSNVHPAVVPQRCVPVLRVCQYWRQLVFKTPQFWANLLSLPTLRSWNPKYHKGRFRAAIARSAPQPLALCIPDSYFIDVLALHAARLSSLKVGPTQYSVRSVPKLFEQRMPRLTHLAILHTSWYYADTLAISFPPNIQSIELQRTSFYTPVAPCTSLRHLMLVECTIKSSPTAGGIPAICAVHNALELFPSLETLSLAHSLSGDDRHGLVRALPELKRTVHLPRLRHLEIKDICAYIQHFLSHLVFPQTTSLVLEPAFFSEELATLPLFPGINPSPSPHAELSLYLYLRSNDNNVTRWETHGAGVRPVRVTIAGVIRHITAISHLTRELVAGLAPAPRRGLTELTVVGGCHDWKSLFPVLPGLRRLTYEPGWAETKDMVDLLCRTQIATDGFACPGLQHLGLVWHLPPNADVKSREEWEPLRRWDDGGLGSPDTQLPASLGAFCDTLGACLNTRAACCEAIRKIEVAPRQRRCLTDEGVVLQEWQVALAEQYLRCRLDHLVGEITVVDEIR